MNYNEAREYLDKAPVGGTDIGLDSVTALANALGNPQDNLKFIHISGTNGKGSTQAFISTILTKAGYKVGRYVSPTVVCYEERIQVNGEYITKEALARLTTGVADACDRLNAKGIYPTAFEIETVIAFLYFVECGCDIVALETGMGGTLDATNIITTTVVSVIASISMDHMDFLGDTLAKIAANKAGIIKPGRPVVSIKQEASAMKVLEEVAKEKGSALTVADPDDIFDVKLSDMAMTFSYKAKSGLMENLTPGLVGMYQKDNAILAIETIGVLTTLGYKVSREDIYAGLAETVWVGRFTKIGDNPRIIIDGAHNEAAAKRLAETLGNYFTNTPIIYIMGVLRDKEYNKILDYMLPYAKEVLTITPNNPRALSASELADVITSRGVRATVMGSVKEALKEAIKKSEKDSIILSFGSLYYLGEVIGAYEELSK
ncbi:MAG: bifunctional folylpolyglutamate synthase/dihydrofolate synthase [Lachnospiraceae bacterium]|nr:bifunctional folylpolyglutamate synthase/dihydrofolate synthase [Lachnospiraceae bacterium]